MLIIFREPVPTVHENSSDSTTISHWACVGSCKSGRSLRQLSQWGVFSESLLHIREGNDVQAGTLSGPASHPGLVWRALLSQTTWFCDWLPSGSDSQAGGESRSLLAEVGLPLGQPLTVRATPDLSHWVGSKRAQRLTPPITSVNWVTLNPYLWFNSPISSSRSLFTSCWFGSPSVLKQ